MDEISLITTQDGSHTLFHSSFNTSYHSRFGAVTESLHVYIQAGLFHFISENQDILPVRILEMGFGTGLNAILSMDVARRQKIQMEYEAVEAYPVPVDKATQFNYLRFSETDLRSYHAMHTGAWGKALNLNDYFTLTKHLSKMEDWHSDKKFDVIYYDAFGPETQPHLWEHILMQKMFNFLKNGGLLVTFCAKGSFKRCLRDVGFEVEALKGPPGKREITRALKR